MDMLRKLGKLKIALILVGVFIVGIVGLAYAFGEPQPDKARPERQPQEQRAEEPKKQKAETPKEDVSDLDLTIQNTISGMVITNKENKMLKGCEVRVNPGTFNDGYKTKADLPFNEPVTIAYSTLTKDSERFDIDKYDVEKVVVTRCEGAPSRMGVYGN